MSRLKFNIVTLITLACQQATPGLETFIKSGFNPLKPMDCEVVSQFDDGSVSVTPTQFELNGFKSIGSRNMHVMPVHVDEKKTSLQVKCFWKSNMYTCEWDHFYWVSLNPERTWRTQSHPNKKPFVYVTGEWLQGVRADKPLQIQCKQQLQ